MNCNIQDFMSFLDDSPSGYHAAFNLVMMMQQQGYANPYGQSYQANQFGQADYGTPFQSAPQQPAQPQMDYAQVYQPAQPVQQPEPAPVQPVQPQPMPQQPAVERNSLGVPAFLRRPTRK